MTSLYSVNRRATPTERIFHANNAVATAAELGDVDGVLAAKRDLQTAVDAGRDAGLTWGAIGNTLGIRRGLAYQRYRDRPAVLAQTPCRTSI